MHVEETPRIRRVLADVASLVDSAARIIRIRGRDRSTPRIRRGRSRPTGVFPFGFRGQDVAPTYRQAAGRLLRGVQTSEENLRVVPAHRLHGTVVARILARRGAQTVRVPRHHRLVLGLRHLVLAQVKALCEGDVVFGLVRLIALSPFVGLPMVKVPGSTQSICKLPPWRSSPP